MSWNYRVVKHVNCKTRVKGIIVDDWWGVHEVYYDLDVPGNLTKSSVGIIGDTYEDLLAARDRWLFAFTKAVIIFDETEDKFTTVVRRKGAKDA